MRAYLDPRVNCKTVPMVQRSEDRLRLHPPSTRHVRSWETRLQSSSRVFLGSGPCFLTSAGAAMSAVIIASYWDWDCACMCFKYLVGQWDSGKQCPNVYNKSSLVALTIPVCFSAGACARMYHSLDILGKYRWQ